MSGESRPGATRLAAAGATQLRASLAVCILLLAAVPALAGSVAVYDLSWNTVDGGGGTWSTGGGYSLGGTAGQPDAGLLEGGGYSLAGGFCPGGATAAPLEQIYLPLVVRGG